MKLVCWKVGPSNLIWAPLTAVITLLLTHICCWGPVLLIPLGMGGATASLNQITALKPFLYLIMSFFLLILGWKTYIKPKVSVVAKMSFWLSVLIVGWSMINA